MRTETVGFIGAGNMAEAIARGMIDSELYPVQSLKASDPAKARRNVFRSMGIQASDDNLALVAECPVLVIAVKPQNLHLLLEQIGPSLTANHLLITICAGCTTSRLESATKAAVRVVRVMPNTPLQVGLGAAALCAGAHATQADMDIADAIFAAAGKVVRIEEHLMDAVTALSGSGPAYIYFLVEAMIEGGRQQGLPRQIARDLAIQTARGAAEMMARTGLPPDELRRRVTSKGGTTEAALRHLHQHEVHEAFVKAIAAAVQRGKDLGKN